MMDWASESLKKVEQTREERFDEPPPGLDDEAAQNLLEEYHPDYLGQERVVVVGPDAGEKNFLMNSPTFWNRTASCPATSNPPWT